MTSIEQFMLFDKAKRFYIEHSNFYIEKNDSEDNDYINYNNTQERQQEYCVHFNKTTDKGAEICIDCGIQLKREITHEKEWRYYGQSDSRHNSDPNRVLQRKCEDRTIYKDVENMGFSERIVNDANKIYADVTSGKIYRGNSRKSIVFASIFHSYKISGKPQTHENLIKIFGLSRKTGLKGLKHINLYASKDSELRTTYITPVNLVEDIMDHFSATPKQKTEVIELYNLVRNKSSKLNRSRPQSVASSIVFYWICATGKDISIKDFIKKVSLSELTINKIAKEISIILGKPDLIKN